LDNAAGQGLHLVTIKFSHVGQTFFGQDLVGTPIYMITNMGANGNNYTRLRKRTGKEKREDK